MKHIKEYKEIDFEDWDEEENDPHDVFKYYILMLYATPLFFIRYNEKYYCLHYIDDYNVVRGVSYKIFHINGHNFYCSDYSIDFEDSKFNIVSNDYFNGIVNDTILLSNDLANGDDRYYKYSSIKYIINDDISFNLSK